MEKRRSPRRKPFNLILGIAFASYGIYRIISLYKGADYSTFRLIIAIGFVVLGAIDLYKYFKPPNRK